MPLPPPPCTGWLKPRPRSPTSSSASPLSSAAGKWLSPRDTRSRSKVQCPRFMESACNVHRRMSDFSKENKSIYETESLVSWSFLSGIIATHSIGGMKSSNCLVALHQACSRSGSDPLQSRQGGGRGRAGRRHREARRNVPVALRLNRKCSMMFFFSN